MTDEFDPLEYAAMFTSDQREGPPVDDGAMVLAEPTLMARPLLRVVAEGEEAPEPLSVLQSLAAKGGKPPGGVSPLAVVPRGYKLQPTKEGVPAVWGSKMTQDGKRIDVPISYTPVIPMARTIDRAGGGVWYDVAIQDRPGQPWRTVTLPATALKNHTKIVEWLGGGGADVNSLNAKKVVGWLADYEAVNGGLIPDTITTAQMGYAGGDDGLGGFLVGSKAVGSPGAVYRAEAGDEGGASDAVRAQGRWDAWCEMYQQTAAYPAVRLAIVASLGAPLLRILGVNSWWYSLAGGTSGGKTTSLRLAASAWGCPKEYMIAWDTTPVGVERLAAARSDMPLIIDDTKQAKSYGNKSAVPEILYQVANERGRQRGKISGLRKTCRWRTIGLSSSEQSLSEYSKDGGTQARVLEVWGSPFGAQSEALADVVTKFTDIAAENYGHAGPLVVGHVFDHRSSWPDWRKEHRELSERIAGAFKHTDRGVASRLAQYAAVLGVTSRIVGKVTGTDSGTAELSWLVHVLNGERVTSRHIQALRDIWDWLLRHQNHFEDDGKRRDENKELYGRWDADTASKPWAHVDVLPSVLREALSKLGYTEPDAVTRAWGADGIIAREVTSDRVRDQVIAKILRAPKRVVRIYRKALDSDAQM